MICAGNTEKTIHLSLWPNYKPWYNQYLQQHHKKAPQSFEKIKMLFTDPGINV
jgi:hypothetical protein